MATSQQVTQLRSLSSYTDTDPYDDPQLSAMIDLLGMNNAAARLWTERASDMAKYVNISESGSSRNMGDLYKNAIAMANHFGKMADAEKVTPDTANVARTRAIVREG